MNINTHEDLKRFIERTRGVPFSHSRIMVKKHADIFSGQEGSQETR